jgi:cytoskeletal protein CcmA (bactofilin family)
MGLFKKEKIENQNIQVETNRQQYGKRPESSSDRTRTNVIRKTLIGESFTIKGEVRATEEIYINGVVEGKIFSKNRVIVGEKGQVRADIHAEEILIKGRVTGNVKGFSKVEVFYNGYLKGNILSKSVVIAEGANFKGNIDMSL